MIFSDLVFNLKTELKVRRELLNLKSRLDAILSFVESCGQQ